MAVRQLTTPRRAFDQLLREVHELRDHRLVPELLQRVAILLGQAVPPDRALLGQPLDGDDILFGQMRPMLGDAQRQMSHVMGLLIDLAAIARQEELECAAQRERAYQPCQRGDLLYSHSVGQRRRRHAPDHPLIGIGRC
jgi:hypothetical protein